MEDKLRETLTEWPNTLNGTETALRLLTQAAIKQVVCSDEELQMLRFFLDLMVQKIDKLVFDGLFTIKTEMLSQIRIISTHLRVEEKYTAYIENYLLFAGWKRELELGFKDIEMVLEDPRRCFTLLELLERKVFEAESFKQHIDLSQ